MQYAKIGTPQSRIDGRAKVTGRALYPSDETVPNPAYASLLTSAIARGRIARFELDAALTMEGVLDILTHENAGHEATSPPMIATTTLDNDRVWQDGQIIGVVVAETYETARDAAFRVKVTYHAEHPSASFESAGTAEEERDDGQHEDYHVGDAEAAFAAAPVQLDVNYGTPTQRDHRPASMRDGDWQVGYGCAIATYAANIAASTARVALRSDGHARVQIAGHEIGTGAYTVVAITAADRLGLPLDRISVEMGNTTLPPASLAAGSSHTASIAHAVARACDELRRRIAQAAVTSNEGPFSGRNGETLRLVDGALVAPDGVAEPIPVALRRVASGAPEAYAENIPEVLPRSSIDTLYQGRLPMLRGHKRQDVTAFSFGAQFIEVRVHSRTREIRVPRMVGAFSAGRMVNPLTAHSQLMSGMIWGLGSALLEATEIDPIAARYVNDNISEYQIAVNADVRDVEVLMLPEPDTAVNPLGLKGVGELGIVAMNAAIANAVHHATGLRVRKLPIRIEDLLTQ